VGQSLA
jgi:hypothetical protein